jgi:hypothetical protein
MAAWAKFVQDSDIGNVLLVDYYGAKSNSPFVSLDSSEQVRLSTEILRDLVEIGSVNLRRAPDALSYYFLVEDARVLAKNAGARHRLVLCSGIPSSQGARGVAVHVVFTPAAYLTSNVSMGSPEVGLLVEGIVKGVDRLSRL